MSETLLELEPRLSAQLIGFFNMLMGWRQACAAARYHGQVTANDGAIAIIA
jgi:hypothetical protein